MNGWTKRHKKAYSSSTVETKVPIILSILLILVFFWGQKANSQKGCPDCLRTAILENFSNPHAPQYEKQLEEWNKCMRQQLGEYASFDPNDPKVKQAMAKCAHLSPPEVDYMHPSSIISKLVEVLTSPCFRIALAGQRFVNSPYSPRIPEYFFRGEFEAGLSGEKDERGRDIKSRLTLELYYNGNPIELVKRWTTSSTLTSVSSQYNRMFDNPDAELRREKPIDDLLRDFERRPVSCQIDFGDKRELKPGEEVEVKLLDFRDWKGRPSKYFNRVIVEVEHGRVDGGIPVVSDPEGDRRCAFRLDDLPLTLVYTAPSEGGQSVDRITVYSSCQILDDGKVLMELTEPHTKIAEEEIKIVRPYLMTDFSTKMEALFPPDLDIDYKFTLNTEIKAMYRLVGYYEQRSTGIVSESYELISRDIKSFSGTGSAFGQEVSGDCVTTTTGSATVSRAEITSASGTLIIDYDGRSGAVREVTLQDISVELGIDGDVTTTQKCTKPPQTETSSFPFKFLVVHPDEPYVRPILDWPSFRKASGDLKSGMISGGGTEELGLWRITLKYSFRKAPDK